MSGSLPTLPSPDEIARLEGSREARGVSEISDLVEPFGGGVMCWSGPGSWTNQAIGVGLHEPVTDAEIDRFVSFYADRGQEPRIEVCPFAHQSLVDGLANRGFITLEFETLLARALVPDDDPRDAIPGGYPIGVAVQEVNPDDEPTLEEWIRVSNSGFAEPGTERDRVFADAVRKVARHPRVDSFAAYIDGEMVGAAAVEIGSVADPSHPEGPRDSVVSAMFAASTLGHARRRGVQQALMAERMVRARDKGARFVCIASAPTIATGRNARRLGFQTAYTTAIMVWRREGLSRSK